MSIRRWPISQKAAFEFIDLHHRHNEAPTGSIFQFGVIDTEDPTEYIAVCIAGRPTARGLDNGASLEVLRSCSTGHPNIPSMMYGAAKRAGTALGYDAERIYTYTIWYEPGTSLVAAGWVQDALLPERDGWDCASRPRPNDPSPRDAKVRWRAA
jgi:hypothetical protein